MLFLDGIKSYSAIQSTLYGIRRQSIPPEPELHENFDTSMDWFMYNGESIVVGDKVIFF